MVVALGAAVAVASEVVTVAEASEAVTVEEVSETVAQGDQDAITMAVQEAAVLTVVMTLAQAGAQVDSGAETDSDLAAVVVATVADPLKAKVVQDASKSLPQTHIRPQIKSYNFLAVKSQIYISYTLKEYLRI